MRSLAELEASRALRAFLALEWRELEVLLLAPMATQTATGDEAAAGSGAAASGGAVADGGAGTDGRIATSDGAAAAVEEEEAEEEEEEAAVAEEEEEAAAAEEEAAAADESSLPLRLLRTLLQHVMSCPLLRSVVRYLVIIPMLWLPRCCAPWYATSRPHPNS